MTAAEPKTLAQRALSLFGDVRASEAADVVLLTLNVFLLLAGYYLLKPVREALILTERGAEIKTYSAAGQALLLLLVVPAYSALTSRMGRMRVITWITFIFVSNLIMFYAFGVAGAREGIPFFIWVGIFNNFIVAQFWSFANDLYSEGQGKRLFPIIGIGSSLGALAGAQIAGPFVHAAGPYPLMLAAAGALLACLALTWATQHRSEKHPERFSSGPAQAPLERTGGFALIARDRYLLLIAVLIIVLNVVNTSGEFLLGKLVSAQAVHAVGPDLKAQEKFVGEFYAHFFSWVNLIGVAVQMFGVSRIFKYIGLRGALFFLPCIALTNYTFLLALPLLQIVRIGKILENSTDYSLMNTVRHALYLPTSREAKYKAKSAIDTFVVRAGDVLVAAIVFVGSNRLGMGMKGFSVMNLGLAVVWLGVVVAIGRRNAQLTAAQEVAKAAGAAA